MNQDSVPPNNKAYEVNMASTTTERPIFSEEAMAQRFKPRTEEEDQRFHHVIARKVKSCKCSPKETLFSLFPIAKWLPKYNFKRDLVADITGGLTVGIFHVPQGLAFAMLTTLPPVTGLYVALVPVLVYMMMGTSRHLSQGSFAVVCLMVAAVINKEVQDRTILATTSVTPSGAINATSQFSPSFTPENSTSFPTTSDTGPSGPWNPMIERRMEVAVTLTLVVGFIQVLMGVARLGVVATYFSDPLVSGFTTGTAVIVVITQVKLILQVPVPQSSGVLGAPTTVFYMLKNIPHVNVGSLITGILCLIIILGLKHINEKFKHKLRFPIPAELIVVILGTAIGYGGELNKNFDVSILGKIAQGLPPVSVPKLSLAKNMFVDAFVIAVVIFATNITVCKLFAKKNGYTIDPNQELIAYGACNISGAFFSCFAVCNALARTAVQENLAKTQLCSVLVAVLIMLVLSFVAPLFFNLPKAVLAAVVIANLVGLLKQFSRVKPLWKICKPDAVVWVTTCIAVIVLGVGLGLAVGVMVSLCSVIFQLSRPYFSSLGQVQKTEIYRDVREFEEAIEEPRGIKIFKFDSSLYFANVEHFRSTLVKVTGVDPCKITNREAVMVSKRTGDGDKAQQATIRKSRTEESRLLEKQYNTLIIDATSFTFIDSMGISTLITLVREYKRVGVNVYIAGCSLNVRKKLAQDDFDDAVGKECLFATVHDAVLHATLYNKTQCETTESDKHTSSNASGDVNLDLSINSIPEQAWLLAPETYL